MRLAKTEKSNEKIILATIPTGENIDIIKLTEWLKNDSKDELSDFFYHRFYNRYLKPFDYENIDYKKNYKNGFTIMASCCLLIETFVSYREPIFLDTNSKSERCFGYFFLTQKEFNSFSKGGLILSEYMDLNRKPLKNKGIPSDFYKNIRCGILHNGETKNKWRVVRNGELFDQANKKINATLFMERLKEVMNEFRNDLKISDFNDVIWINYKSRLKNLIDKSIRN